MLLHIVKKTLEIDNGKFEDIVARQEIIGIELLFKDEDGNLHQIFLRPETFDHVSNFVLKNNWERVQMSKKEYEDKWKPQEDELPF